MNLTKHGVSAVLALAAGLAVLNPLVAAAQSTSNVVIQWNNATLQGVRDSNSAAHGGKSAGDRTHLCL